MGFHLNIIISIIFDQKKNNNDNFKSRPVNLQ
jgi:hypothetical protein